MSGAFVRSSIFLYQTIVLKSTIRLVIPVGKVVRLEQCEPYRGVTEGNAAAKRKGATGTVITEERGASILFVEGRFDSIIGRSLFYPRPFAL